MLVAGVSAGLRSHGATAPSASDLRLVGHDQLGIEVVRRAEAAAGRAGAVRAVEREQARRQLRQRDAAGAAGEALAVERLAAPASSPLSPSTATLTRRRRRSLKATPSESASRASMPGRMIRRSTTTSMVCFWVLARAMSSARSRSSPSMRARTKPGLAQLDQLLAELALPAAHDRRQDVHAACARAASRTRSTICCTVCGRDRLAALPAVRRADAGEEQAQVVVDLGDGADRRARVLAGRLLLDGDRRREPVDRVDVGLLHLLEELPRVGRERLDVAPLPLGVDGVEGERRLARSRQAGDHHQLVARDLDGDVLEVVLARPDDDDRVRHERANLEAGCRDVRGDGRRRRCVRTARRAERARAAIRRDDRRSFPSGPRPPSSPASG